jgi:pseudouridine-5'-phosphate glycosidase
VNDPVIAIAAEVGEAVRAGGPVVALESTIITHGMPYPQNLATARAVEQVVRQAGAVPATIAVRAGRVRVGLDDVELERLAVAPPGSVAKASRRDLPALLSRGAAAGTTVAATMAMAHAAGIAIFATGGIGGVHLGAQSSMDVSADLVELGRTPVTVVCAGAKSILDLSRTLEVLETQGVSVLGYRTDAFPAFYTRDSGLRVDHRVDSPQQLARVIRAHRGLDGTAGLLVANPIPEQDELPPAQTAAAIAQAVAAAERDGVARANVTPYLLARLNELTGGASLAANIALVRNNALLAAQTAVALASGGR